MPLRTHRYLRAIRSQPTARTNHSTCKNIVRPRLELVGAPNRIQRGLTGLQASAELIQQWQAGLADNLTSGRYC